MRFRTGGRTPPTAKLALVLLVAISCNGGLGGGCGGCGSCNTTGYEFPIDDPNRPDAVLLRESSRIRVTQEFLDFLRPKLPDIIRSQLGSQPGFRVDANNILHVPIPDSELFDLGFVASADIREGEALIWLDDLENRLDFFFERPNGVRLTMRNMRIGVNLDLREQALGSSSSCPIAGTLGPGPLHHAAEITMNVLIEPGVGPDPERKFDMAVTIDDITLDDLALDVAGSSTYCNEPECQDCALEVGGSCLDPGGRCNECYVFCGGLTNVTLSIVTGLVDILNPLLNRLLKPVIGNFVRSALADFNNQPANIETQVNLFDLSGLPMFRESQPFGILFGPEPGKFPIVDRGVATATISTEGMEITSVAGAEAELADCVPAIGPFSEPKGPVPELAGRDRRNRPYHIAMTFAAPLVNNILHAVHRSGALCLKITSADVNELTGGKFTLNAALLSILASDLSKLAKDRAPAIIQLKPRNPAHIELGTGEVTGQDANGNDVYDPLIKLSIKDMGLAFHVFIQDRYVRVFEVTMDVDVGLNMVVLPDNTLQAALTKVEIHDFVEDFNEILPNADFAEVLPTLIDLAFSAFLTNQLTFDLDLASIVSDALGGAPLAMRVNEIFRDGAQNDYLTLTMTFYDPATGMLRASAETDARLAADPELLERRVARRMSPTGRARLEVGASAFDPRLREYQVRVDGGLWHAPQRPQADGTVVVEDAKLKIPGAHAFEVRARYVDDYESLDPTPAQLETFLDVLPPEVTLEVKGDSVEVTVEDERLEGLTARATLTGSWGERSIELPLSIAGAVAFGRVPLASVGDARRLEVSATDSTGNESSEASIRVGYLEEEKVEASGCRCTSRPASGLMLGLLALVALRRRR
ncbi:MAG: hypothetical protein HYV07_05590 [Deltaproteobacteria bacterium]|nr:hypothetical protein [Deltaproteobacteria bacterium]